MIVRDKLPSWALRGIFLLGFSFSCIFPTTFFDPISKNVNSTALTVALGWVIVSLSISPLLSNLSDASLTQFFRKIAKPLFFIGILIVLIVFILKILAFFTGENFETGLISAKAPETFVASLFILSLIIRKAKIQGSNILTAGAVTAFSVGLGIGSGVLFYLFAFHAGFSQMKYIFYIVGAITGLAGMFMVFYVLPFPEGGAKKNEKKAITRR